MQLISMKEKHHITQIHLNDVFAIKYFAKPPALVSQVMQAVLYVVAGQHETVDTSPEGWPINTNHKSWLMMLKDPAKLIKVCMELIYKVGKD